ncbi:Isopentenyl-diphosphate Delta-isomerase [Roseovarius litorisediminis]|uniref:isopentenyl-diphosphate Delta-isomerase n=1 Tax=Roseovarius litorisediminis TaxID=1312363 RepID=A0A1Y5T8W4_9RHOB|nr:NUDIX domain-containing protein [Roseovarius litorisediminis]SLN56461.1 Isopentenyl-diphosphate Delta-isomerase [Roseovarius litorisediminis]
MPDLIPAWDGEMLVPVEKLDVHRRGLRHKAVSVFAIAGDQTLLQRRALGKYHTPGLWANTCCTHPNWNESPFDCAVRRLEQELNIKDAAPQHRGHVSYRADVGGGMIEHEEVDIFVLKVPAPFEVTPNSDEVMDTRWTTFSALADDIQAAPLIFTPWIRIYLDQHKAMILA